VALVNVAPQQDEIWTVRLDPTVGSEIKKTRPCLIISPDEMNEHLRTVLVAPLTTAIRPYPSRLTITFQGEKGQIALDQVRCVDQSRAVKKLGTVTALTAEAVSNLLIEIFRRG
jgi:mRNA interferase MazF